MIDKNLCQFTVLPKTAEEIARKSEKLSQIDDRERVRLKQNLYKSSNEKVNYKLNEFGFRCDEFNDLQKADKIVIFSGCSLTFGTGLHLEDTWAFKLYNHLKEKNPNLNIPYINLAAPGTGLNYTNRIIYEFIEYFNIKKVDAIFSLCLDSRRREINFTDFQLSYAPFKDLSVADLKTAKYLKFLDMILLNDGISSSIAIDDIRHLHTLSKLVDAQLHLGIVNFKFNHELCERLQKYTESQNFLNTDNLSNIDLNECDLGYDAMHISGKYYDKFVEDNLDLINKI